MINHSSTLGFAPLLKRLLWILGIGGVAYAIYAEWHGMLQMHLLGYDYAFFYYAFEVVVHHQAAWHLYDISTEQAFLARCHFPFLQYNQYVYPPQFALLWSPLGALPFRISLALWMLMSTLLYCLGVTWIVRMLWPRIRGKYVMIILLFAIVLTPFQIDLGVGNVNSVLFAAVALTFYLLYHRRKPWLAGIPLGLAIVFKVTPLAILVYLLLRRQWRVSISAVLTTATISGLAAIELGSSSLIHYASDFLSFGQTSMKNGPAPYNQSVLGVLSMFVQHHWFFLSDSSQKICFIVYAAIAAVLILHSVRRTQADWKTDMSLACLTPVIFSPLVEEMHMLYALPALLVMLRRTKDSLAAGTGIGRQRFTLLGFVTLGCYIVLSLPATFALNRVVGQFPQLFWLQTGMFWVTVILFIAVISHSMRPVSIGDIPILKSQN